jgi:hypothetical protein
MGQNILKLTDRKVRENFGSHRKVVFYHVMKTPLAVHASKKNIRLTAFWFWGSGDWAFKELLNNPTLLRTSDPKYLLLRIFCLKVKTKYEQLAKSCLRILEISLLCRWAISQGVKRAGHEADHSSPVIPRSVWRRHGCISSHIRFCGVGLS